MSRASIGEEGIGWNAALRCCAHNLTRLPQIRYVCLDRISHCCRQLPTKDRAAGSRGFEEVDVHLPCKIFRNDLVYCLWGRELSRHFCWELLMKDMAAAGGGFGEQQHFASVRCHSSIRKFVYLAGWAEKCGWQCTARDSMAGCEKFCIVSITCCMQCVYVARPA